MLISDLAKGADKEGNTHSFKQVITYSPVRQNPHETIFSIEDRFEVTTEIAQQLVDGW